jgi:hypothetical protein
MSKLTVYFKEPHRSFGVFYPLHCIVAVFADMSTAEQAHRLLEAAGFDPTDVIAVDGTEFIALQTEETGRVRALMRRLSRFGATEQISTDHNLELAERGAAFVLVHCASGRMKEKAWKAMEGLAPVAAHYYDRLGVDHLAGGFCTTE